jgi:HD-like signal output (HDOD) protein
VSENRIPQFASPLPKTQPIPAGGFKGNVSPDDVIRDLRQLPSTAKILPKLLEILRDDQASMGDVVSLIKIDPGMAARVLQIGNSAYYSPSHAARCPTMEDAVYRVGLVKVYELVAYAATAQLLMRPLRSYRMEADAVWQASVTCALAAERLARHVDVDFNAAYTAGLLHVVGIVAMDTWAATQELPPQFLNGGLPNETTESEKSLLGFTNSSVAGALLKSWSFPASIIEPIRWQFAPASAGGHKKMAALVHTAKWLRDAVHVEAEKPLPAAPDPAILDILKLEPADLEASLDEVKDAFLKASLLLADPADSGTEV